MCLAGESLQMHSQREGAIDLDTFRCLYPSSGCPYMAKITPKLIDSESIAPRHLPLVRPSVQNVPSHNCSNLNIRQQGNGSTGYI